ncbi:hypothetical protein SISNIDRAFT_487250 [Sistotremastrum niveocremeum HHB9708]|uniref:DRBM domain-containing protein n=1 Tax=Sistotremastrum niveocremeum HHB9708 TaxID=1314777 RepID=A0A164SKP3_9AGAM|nr:hypothetical protein SISNIDRAFT_487250 [Sistotremastrum niveocremeum HHB9708]
MGALHDLLAGYQYNRNRGALDQLNELAQQKHVNLTWYTVQDGPSHKALWQACPVVNNRKFSEYLIAAPNVQDAKGDSAKAVFERVLGIKI